MQTTPVRAALQLAVIERTLYSDKSISDQQLRAVDLLFCVSRSVAIFELCGITAEQHDVMSRCVALRRTYIWQRRSMCRIQHCTVHVG